MPDMFASEFPQASWRKACHANNTCVEVAGLDGTVGARDGKLGANSRVLQFSRLEWRAGSSQGIGRKPGWIEPLDTPLRRDDPLPTACGRTPPSMRCAYLTGSE